ncbi:hypothetical protein MTR_1g106630 [Medicago truncatula]|nr:hypothetical protein MTR_1g106630 [Medicago truncatula]
MGSNSRGKDGEGTSGINRVYDDDDDSYECLQEMNFVPYETLLHSNMNTNGFVAPFVMQQESSLLRDMDKNDIDESFFDTNDIR